MFKDFADYYGFNPIVCRPYWPRTKGKIEKPNQYIERDFFLGRSFYDIDDMNRQAIEWLNTVANVRIHGTTNEIPIIRLEEEKKYFRKADKEENPLPVSRRPTTSKDEGAEMEFRIASVNKAHSAWSSILAFKNIAYLHEGTYHGGGRRDYLKLLTQRDILYSILHHTSEEPKDEAVNRFQFVLLLMDDIEETIRYSRGGKQRGRIRRLGHPATDVADARHVEAHSAQAGGGTSPKAGSHLGSDQHGVSGSTDFRDRAGGGPDVSGRGREVDR